MGVKSCFEVGSVNHQSIYSWCAHKVTIPHSSEVLKAIMSFRYLAFTLKGSLCVCWWMHMKSVKNVKHFTSSFKSWNNLEKKLTLQEKTHLSWFIEHSNSKHGFCSQSWLQPPDRASLSTACKHTAGLCKLAAARHRWEQPWAWVTLAWNARESNVLR